MQPSRSGDRVVDALRPPALRRGDVIGIAALASAFNPEPFQRGVDWLVAQGFRVRLAPGIDARHHYLAGTAAQRLSGLTALLTDPEIRAIFCARGGFGSMHLLEGIDWRLLAERPRIFMGYSDLTPVLGAIRERAGLVCYHGPVMTGLVDVCDEASRAHLLSSLTRWQGPPEPLTGGRCLAPGVVEAETVGGNLTMLAATVGTPYQVSLRGRILLLEEVGERPYRVDRALTQLRLSGALDGVAGIAAGTFERCVEADGRGRDMDGLLVEALGPLGVPMCAGLPYGHGPANRLVPIGARGRLDAGAGSLGFPDPVVSPPDDMFGAT